MCFFFLLCVCRGEGLVRRRLYWSAHFEQYMRSQIGDNLLHSRCLRSSRNVLSHDNGQWRKELRDHRELHQPRYSQLSTCGYPPITDKIQFPGRRGLTGNASRYYGLSLLRTINKVPRVSPTTRVDCNRMPDVFYNNYQFSKTQQTCGKSGRSSLLNLIQSIKSFLKLLGMSDRILLRSGFR